MPGKSAHETPEASAKSTWRILPDMPLTIWMVLSALVIAFVGGMTPEAAIGAFNDGFGHSVGEFALILLPSFVIAAALSRAEIMPDNPGRIAALASPLAGAGMICPDTAYAALSPATSDRKLDVAFGAYAGFKLLFPAGPLVVATGLGVDDSGLLLAGIALTLPVWATGVAWARFAGSTGTSARADGPGPRAGLAAYRVFLPFALLALLLVAAPFVGATGIDAVDFLLQPKGALFAAAVVALLQTPGEDRRACLDSAVRRTGALLLVIGAASAFGAILTQLVPIQSLIPSGSGMAAVLGFFALTVAFKLIQGSSMATFAAVSPVAAPFVLSSGLPPAFAVFAICLGSFVAILPNDSFYWLVRRDALKDVAPEIRAIQVLAGGALIQAIVGLCLLLFALAVLP